MRLASSPASNQPCSQPSWTRFSSSHRLQVLRRCQRFRLRFPFGPASDQPCGRPLGTCLRISLPAPALRRCLRLGLRLALGPASNWYPARAFSSTSGLNLQLLTACRFSGRRRASVRTRVLRFMPCGLSLFLGPSVSPSVQSCDCSRGLRSPAEVRSRLAPFASAQPSCRLPAPAFDAGLAPFVSCHSFRPAFWPASLRRFGSRLCAFVLKRPSGMPLSLRRRLLAPAVSTGPRAGFQDLRLFLQPSGNRPLACASADCSGLAAFTSCGCQLPQGLWTTGLSILDGLAPI